MSRVIIYPGAIPLETDLLRTAQFNMIEHGKIAQAVLGLSTSGGAFVHGLACIPTTPASLNVIVGGGQIYAPEELEATAYSSLAADTTDTIIKQGITIPSTTFPISPPSTVGFSQVFLIEAAFEETDGDAVTLPYYNASNPSQAYAGPNNSGTAQNTTRKAQCALQLKAGVAAATGTQVAPAVDAGWTALWTVTVANGQTTITSGNIAQVSGAPFIAGLLNQHHLGINGQAPKIDLTAEVRNVLPYANMSPVRIPLLANTTFYVSASGSDANNGLASGTAWATLAHAYSTILNNYDLAGFTVTISIGTGTFAPFAATTQLVGQNGYLNLILNGAGSSTVITTATSSPTIYANGLAGFTISNMEITNTGGDSSVFAQYGGGINIGAGVTVGATSNAQLDAGEGGRIIVGNITLTGNAAYAFWAHRGATIEINPGTVTFSGTPAYSQAAAVATDDGQILVPSGSVTMSGPATGVRYSATMDGSIDTQGGGANFFPGSSSGSTATGGQYA